MTDRDPAPDTVMPPVQPQPKQLRGWIVSITFDPSTIKVREYEPVTKPASSDASK